MAYQKWTPEEEKRLIDLRRDGYTNRHIAKELKRSYNCIEKKSIILIKKNELVNRRTEEPFLIPKEPPDYTDFFKIQSKDFMVIADVHLPYIHKETVSKCLAIGKKFKIPTLIIAGDLFDLRSFSRFVISQDPFDDLDLTVKIASDFLKDCLSVFKEIYIICGNHDARIFKSTNGKIRYSQFFKMVEGNKQRIFVSDYSYCFANGNWMICHPENFSGRGGQTPSDLSEIYHRNVIASHNHVCGIQTSLSGDYLGIDCGMACSLEKTEYAMKVVTKHRKWINGFCMVKSNLPYLFITNKTDWSFWL